METYIKNRLVKIPTAKSGVGSSNPQAGLFDEKNKHIFRTAPDRGGLRLPTK